MIIEWIQLIVFWGKTESLNFRLYGKIERGRRTFYRKFQNNTKKCLTNVPAHVSIINGSLVKRLRRRPLTAETRVRFPYGLLKTDVKFASVFLFMHG